MSYDAAFLHLADFTYCSMVISRSILVTTNGSISFLFTAE